MNKLSILLIAVILGGFSAAYAVKTIVISPYVQSGISKYKTGNYLGAMQDMQGAVSQNPEDSMAQYYLGNIYTRIGKKDEAKKAYEKVKAINKNEALVKYSDFALKCIEHLSKSSSSAPQVAPPAPPVDPTQPVVPVFEPCDRAVFDAPGDIDGFVRSGQFLHTDAKAKIQEEQLKNIQNNINGGSKAVEFSNYRYLNDASGAMPSDEEIANAVKTLAKVGFNPLSTAQSYNNNPQYSQLSAFLGQPNSNNNNGMASMMPLMMAQGSNDKINPQLMQSMMMNQMMPGYDFSDMNRNRGY